MNASFALDHPPDHELVARFRDGDAEAFEWLVKRHYPAVERFFRARLTGDRSLSEDLAQETFFHAAAHIDQLKNDLAFRGWLFKIARNTLSSHRRAQGRRIALPLLLALQRLAPARAGTAGIDNVAGCHAGRARHAVYTVVPGSIN